MSEFFNHNSFLLILGFIWVAAAALLLRGGMETRKLLAFIGLTVLVLAGYFFFRPAASSDDPAGLIQAQIGNGQPVLLEFQSQN